MGTIEMFVVICTVVLFCSWGYIIWSNWKSDKLVRFPPYGFDSCPIGYVLDQNGTKCNGKDDYDRFYSPAATSAKPEPPAETNPNSIQVCNLFNRVQGEDGGGTKMIWDGIPNKHSHKDWTNNKMYKLLESCCTEGEKKGCNQLQFSSVIGQPDSTLDE